MKTQQEIDEEHRLHMQSPEAAHRQQLLKKEEQRFDSMLLDSMLRAMHKYQRRQRYLRSLPTGKRERLEAQLADKSLYVPQVGSCDGRKLEVIPVEVIPCPRFW